GAENPWQDEDGNQENGHLLADADARAYTIAGLTDAGEYDVEVAGITDFGIGLWSAAQSAVVPDASLSDLTAAADGQTLTLTPAFASGKYTYTAMAVTAALTAQITALVNNSGASHRVNGNAPANPGDAVAVALSIGDTSIEIVVTADDGNSMRTYALVIARPEGRAGMPQNVALTPALGSIAVAWELPLFSGVATLADCHWRIRWRVAVPSGAENPWQDEDGDQENGHLVTNPAARGYTITSLTDGVEYDVQVAGVTSFGIGLWSAAQSAVVPDASLSGLTAAAGGQMLRLTPAFASGKYTYTAMVATAALTAQITALVSNSGASHRVNGNAPANPGDAVAVALSIGDTSIEIVVTADDGNSMRTYALVIARPEGRAGMPQNVALTPALGSIAVAWELPLFSGVATLADCHWRIRWRVAVPSGAENPWQDEDGDQENGHLVTNPAARGYTITSLTDGVEYDVQVAGVTSFGIGLWSAAQSAVSIDPSLRGLTLTGGGQTPALSPAFDSGVYSYRVMVETPAFRISVAPLVNTAGATYLVNGNPPASAGAAVEVALPVGDSAINVLVTADDGSSMRTYTLLITRPAGKAGAPQNVRLETKLGGILVSWQAPQYLGGSAVTQHRIRWREGVESGAENLWRGLFGDAENGELLDDRAASEYTITNLTDGAEYDVQVAVVTADAGVGLWSAEQSTTPGNHPNVPRNLRAVPGRAQVELSWHAPVPAAGAPVTDYRVRWRRAGAAAYNNGGRGVATGGTAVNYTATGLSNNVAYEFQVGAVSAIGDGPWSLAVRATPNVNLAQLNGLFISAGGVEYPLTPAFAPGIIDYQLSVPNSVSSVSIALHRLQARGGEPFYALFLLKNQSHAGISGSAGGINAASTVRTLSLDVGANNRFTIDFRGISTVR
ncbi:MAG: cadherin-like beta sandwich domain-containing protein, partial [Gammaproteobacteria bacterium]